MPTKDEGVGRADMLKFEPGKIADIRQGVNLRHGVEPESGTERLARDIAANGQMSPVIVRKDSAKAFHLVAGFRRVRAVLKINADPEAYGLPGPIPLLARLMVLTEDEALVRNLAENEERLDLGPLDLAFAARHLSTVMQWDQARIAEAMKCSPSRVSGLIKLLSLPKDVLRRLASGGINEATAKRFGGLDDEQVATLLEAIDGGEKPARVARRAQVAAGKRTRLTIPEALALLDSEENDQAAALAAWIRCEGDLEAAKLGDFPPPNVGTVGEDGPQKTFICLDCLHEQAPGHEGCEECQGERVIGKAAALKALESREVAA